MKKKIISGMLLVIAAIFQSCSEFSPSDGRYYVRSLDEYADETRYHLIQVTGHGSTFMNAERGLYHVNDTLAFAKYRSFINNNK